MNNKKLFEEAIAEAKSIREAAIANAKEALEESLTPQIKELLAQRLTEMEEEDELPEPPEEKLPVLEKEEEGEEKEEEAEEAGEEEEKAGEESEEDKDIEDMSVEELKDLIRSIVGQMVDSDGDGDHDMEDHGMEGPEMPDMGMEEPAGEEAPEEEEIDLDELLAELAEDGDQLPAPPEEIHVDLDEEETVNEAMIDPDTIQAFLQALETDPSLLSGEAVAKILGAGVASIFGTGFGISKIMELLKKGKLGKTGQDLAQGLEDAASASGVNEPRVGKTGFSEAIVSELNEAKATIKKLTENLQEVNLLNAKLLYVNKVLKENKHLSDSQVANVIATFDKATTAKEAKLVYESFSTSLVKKSNAPVIESKLKQFASKSTGVAPAAKVEVISEVSDAVKRMQKLAGIIK